MSIIRIKKEEKYAVISNYPLNDCALTWEARGVMAYLLSKPDGWQCRNYDLVNQGPASRHIIRRVINELQEAGYIHRYQQSSGKNTLEWITEIYETPELNTAFRSPGFSTAKDFASESFDGEKSGHIVSTDESKYLPTENTEKNMAKNAESDFSDLFSEPVQVGAVQQPKELDDNGKAHLLAFGVLPDDNPDPEVYAARQELQAAGWEIHSQDQDVELAVVYFVLAVRSQHPGFKIPNDTGSRKQWYRSVNAHLQNYMLSELQDLYKRAIIKMDERNLSYWVPGSLTNWALPEIANESRPAHDIDLSKGFYV